MKKEIFYFTAVWVILYICMPIAGCKKSSHSTVSQEFPSQFDLRDEGIITPAKDQGECGSCWAFAPIGVFEALIKRETGLEVDLSEQHIISCAPGRGCNGGAIYDAFQYMQDHGAVFESRCPYQGAVFPYNPQGRFDYRLTGYYMRYTSELSLEQRIALIKDTLLRYGPVATNMILWEDMKYYQSGVFVHDPAYTQQEGHNILIVGWQDDAQVKNGGYWIAKNSAGPNWGENGFIRIAYGEAEIENFYICYAEYHPNQVAK